MCVRRLCLVFGAAGSAEAAGDREVVATSRAVISMSFTIAYVLLPLLSGMENI